MYLDTNGGGGGSVGLGQNTSIGPYLVGNTLPNGDVRGAYSASRMLFNGGGFSFQTSTETSGARTFDDRMKILINGNVGIGQTGPGQKLVIGNYGSAADGTMRLTALGGQPTAGTIRNSLEFSLSSEFSVNSGDAYKFSVGLNSAVGNQGSYNSDFVIRRTTRLGVTDNVDFLIDGTSGNIGIGSSIPNQKLSIATNAITSNPEYIEFQDFGAGSNWAIGMDFGGLQWHTGDGTGIGPHLIAQIKVQNERNGAAAAGALVFSTAPYNTVMSERMRITSGGEIHIKNGTTTGGKILLGGTDNDLQIDGSRGQIIYSINGTYQAVLDSNQFYPNSDNSLNLGIASLRWSTVYAANGVNTSDETLKENIKECDLGINFIDSLKPKSYNLKDLKENNDAYGKKRYGLIAQDILETELKDSVFGKKDGEYGLSYNDLIAPMIKAIQELKAEIELLKSK